MIKFENISKIYPAGLTALDNVSFEVGAKEFILWLGNQEQVKSTLLKTFINRRKTYSRRYFF